MHTHVANVSRIPHSKLVTAVWVVAGLLLAACGEPQETELAVMDIGTVDFPTTCSEDVQPDLERGLGFLHHMMYQRARDLFGEAATSSPDCAMAHWGVAMTHFQPLWGSAQIEEGRPAADRAASLASTARQEAYTQASLAFYQGENLRLDERIRNWEAAMEEAYLAHPEDSEVAALFALAHLAVDPTDPQRQATSDAVLERLHEEMPRHPGAIHYAIHVHDVEGRAEEGVPYARAYQDLAPTVPHALHMPSHIYVRLGEWEEVIDWNRRSAEAALQYPVAEYVSHHHAHALDYLMYGYLQRAQDDEAQAVMDDLLSRDDYQPTFVSAYALAAVPARWHLERRRWEDAAEVEPGMSQDFPWQDFPEAQAITQFARGIGAARSGDLEAAEDASARLAELEEAARAQDKAYWVDRIRTQRQSVDAWQALVEGDVDRAVDSMREVVAMADETEKHPVTPGRLKPAEELFGDLLLEAGRAGDALEAYDRSLETWPRRYQSYLGAARAAEAAGEEETAQRFYERLVDLTADASALREGVLEAREVLSVNR